MKPYILFLLLLFSFSVSAQITPTTKSSDGSDFSYTESSDSTEVITIVERMPTYKGCEKEKTEELRNQCTYKKIQEFLAKNINYPVNSRDMGITGTVYITFVIDPTGYTVEPKVIRGVNEELDNEALRVISLMPQWNPGMQKGKYVKVQYTIPIKFNLRNPKGK